MLRKLDSVSLKGFQLKLNCFMSRGRILINYSNNKLVKIQTVHFVRLVRSNTLLYYTFIKDSNQEKHCKDIFKTSIYNVLKSIAKTQTNEKVQK